jgi:hypothetical protein
MGAYFSTLIAAIGLCYCAIGLKCRRDVVNNLQESGKYGDYTLYDLHQNNIVKPRKLIQNQKPFTLFSFFRDDKPFNFFGEEKPIYWGVGYNGSVSLPLGDIMYATTESKGICDEWDRFGVYGSLHRIRHQQYNQSIYLPFSGNIHDFCRDAGVSSTQFHIDHPVRARFVTTNTLHIVSDSKTCCVGINRRKLIGTASKIISEKIYPGYIGVGMICAAAMCIKMM